MKDYAVQLCLDQEAATGSLEEIFNIVLCVEGLYEPLPDNSPAITERYLEGASQHGAGCQEHSRWEHCYAARAAGALHREPQ